MFVDVEGELGMFYQSYLDGFFLSKYIKNYIPTLDGRNPANHLGCFFETPHKQRDFLDLHLNWLAGNF